MADGEIIFKTYAVTAAAVALSDSTALNTTVSPRRLTIQSAAGALNTVYLGGSGVTAAGAAAGRELVATAEVDLLNQDPAEVYVIGVANAANLLYITAQF